jgi:hypothetical protein
VVIGEGPMDTVNTCARTNTMLRRLLTVMRTQVGRCPLRRRITRRRGQDTLHRHHRTAVRREASVTLPRSLSRMVMLLRSLSLLMAVLLRSLRRATSPRQAATAEHSLHPRHRRQRPTPDSPLGRRVLPRRLAAPAVYPIVGPHQASLPPADLRAVAGLRRAAVVREGSSSLRAGIYSTYCDRSSSLSSACSRSRT